MYCNKNLKRYFLSQFCQLPFDELTPEEQVRQLEKEKQRLAAKAQEEAIEGNTCNENDFYCHSLLNLKCLSKKKF
jgi:hypothetical protein